MTLVEGSERDIVVALTQMAVGNPFLPERLELERQVLGEAYVEAGRVWAVRPGEPLTRPNTARLRERATAIAERLRERLRSGERASSEELALYQDLTQFVLFETHAEAFHRAIAAPRSACRFYGEFRRQAEHFREPARGGLPDAHSTAHTFASFFQIRRAFHHVFRFILGISEPAAQLRATVWESIFTHDLRRYSRSLYRQMADWTTLVTGESGTGKELVARAIGLSRYVPFDERTETFTESFPETFHPVNLSALSPTLIESELFGHRRGAFTGAVGDRAGWLEVCGAHGTIFLDEIGELDPALQVKLLRVLQTQSFERIGETRTIPFHGKVVAATHRDLAAGIETGDFREDLYYRLCSDRIETPTLRDQLRSAPEDLGVIVGSLAARLVGEEEAEALTMEVERWIAEQLGADYPWPGNVRELEQCVRNIVIRGRYRPNDRGKRDPRTAIAAEILGGGLTADEILNRACTLVYADVGSYLETGRRLGLDRRTVKGRIDAELLARLRGT